MTISDLIKALSKYPSDSVVVLDVNGNAEEAHTIVVEGKITIRQPRGSIKKNFVALTFAEEVGKFRS